MSSSTLAGSHIQEHKKVSISSGSSNISVQGFHPNFKHENNSLCLKPKNPFQTYLPSEPPQSGQFSKNPFMTIGSIIGPMSMAHLKGFGGIISSTTFPSTVPVAQPVFGQMNTFGMNEKKNEPALKESAKQQVHVEISKQMILSIKAPRQRPSRGKGGIMESKERIRTLRQKLELPVLQVFPHTFDDFVDSDFLMEPTEEHQSSGQIEKDGTKHQTFHEYLLICAEVRKSI
jgi:hypothetical protein